MSGSRYSIFAAVFMAISTLLPIHSFAEDDIKIEDPWIRATPPKAKVAAGFLVIKNNRDEDIAIVSITTDAAETVEFHKTIIENDVAQMRPLGDKVIVPAKGEYVFKPLNDHLMLMQIEDGFKEGDKVNATVNLENGEKLETVFNVYKRGPEHDHGAHDHSSHDHGHSDHKDHSNKSDHGHDDHKDGDHSGHNH